MLFLASVETTRIRLSNREAIGGESNKSKRNIKNLTTMRVSISATTSPKSIRTSTINQMIVAEVEVVVVDKIEAVVVDVEEAEAVAVVQPMQLRLRVTKSARTTGVRIRANAALKQQMMASFWTQVHPMKRSSPLYMNSFTSISSSATKRVSTRRISLCPKHSSTRCTTR